jgi:hypothetical protein
VFAHHQFNFNSTGAVAEMDEPYQWAGHLYNWSYASSLNKTHLFDDNYVYYGVNIFKWIRHFASPYLCQYFI